MNIYKVTRPGEEKSNEYDSFICCARTKDDAIRIYPNEEGAYDDFWINIDEIGTLEVVELGKADDSTEEGVLLASFNGR